MYKARYMTFFILLLQPLSCPILSFYVQVRFMKLQNEDDYLQEKHW
jgi:hypothetical protein